MLDNWRYYLARVVTSRWFWLLLILALAIFLVFTMVSNAIEAAKSFKPFKVN
jgi:hypothetical protein